MRTITFIYLYLIQSIRKLTAELAVIREHQPELVIMHIKQAGVIVKALLWLFSHIMCITLQTLEEARRKLATIDNELRKEKMISRHYQVATERLVQFVEV